MKDNGDVEFLDLFDPRQPRSDKELIESRLAICNTCPWFNKNLQKCKQLIEKKSEKDKELIEHRLAICNTCPFFNKTFQKCRQCGCFMRLKTTLVQATCPAGHW